jgi:CheY-like chemotaxis protein
MSVTELHGLRVLVVEDEAYARGVFEVALQRCGADVVCADSATAALALFRTHPPDVLVSDISMPEHDGYWFIAQVRALEPRRVVPAVAVTGNSYEPARALAEGFHEYLTKPIDPDHLCVVVGRLASLIPRD